MINYPAIKNIPVHLSAILKFSVVVSLLIFIFVYAHTSIHDLDIWLHLKAGEIILEHKSVPAMDTFSFTRQGKPWIDHEWLFQVLAYSIYSHWQADGLIFLQSLIIMLSFLVLFFIGYKATDSYLGAGIWLLITAYAVSSRFNIRPDIFSMLFFAVYLYILKFHSNDKSIWLLVPMQLIWLNLHGYFFLGPLLVFLFIFAEFLRCNLKSLRSTWKEKIILEEKAYRRLKKVLLFMVLVSFLNPAGLKGALYPLYVFRDIVFGRSTVFFSYIQELQPTYKIASDIINLEYFYLLLIFSCAFLLVNFKELTVIDILLAISFFFFSFKLRNIAFCGFISYTLIASYLNQTVAKFSQDIRLSGALKDLFYLLLHYIAALVFIFALISNINAYLGRHYYDFETQEFKSNLQGIRQKRYPEGALDFILQNKLTTRMFNDFNSGAYLIGRAYPQRQVFIDGRTELYGQDFFKAYMEAYKGDSAIFESIVEQYQISAVLLSMTSAKIPKITSYIYKNPQWKLVYFDDTAVVFLKNIPSNSGLISRYAMDLKKYAVPTTDLKEFGLRRIYPDPYIRRAELFDLFEEDEAVLQEAKEALRIMPGCAEAYYLMGKVYLRKGQYQQARDFLRSAVLFLPNNVDMLMDLARCLAKLKENKLAVNALKKAIRIDETKGEAYSLLKDIYSALHHQAGAVWAAKRESKFSTEHIQTQRNRSQNKK